MKPEGPPTHTGDTIPDYYDQFYKEALAIAQRISMVWKQLKQKVETNPGLLVTATPDLNEAYDMTKPPTTGIQLWFESRVAFIRTATTDKEAKAKMMSDLKERLERLEEEVKDFLS